MKKKAMKARTVVKAAKPMKAMIAPKSKEQFWTTTWATKQGPWRLVAVGMASALVTEVWGNDADTGTDSGGPEPEPRLPRGSVGREIVRQRMQASIDADSETKGKGKGKRSRGGDVPEGLNTIWIIAGPIAIAKVTELWRRKGKA